MKKYLVAAAFAATLSTPALAQDRSFGGPWLGAVVGWDHSSDYGIHGDGVVFGAGLGYDFNLDGDILGVEGEASDATTKKFGTKAGIDLYGGARVGAIVAPGTLLYVKAGYTNVRVSYSGSHTNLDGFRAGGGVEHLVGRNAFVKAEYRYSNYEQGFSRHQVVAGAGIRF